MCTAENRVCEKEVSKKLEVRSIQISIGKFNQFFPDFDNELHFRRFVSIPIHIDGYRDTREVEESMSRLRIISLEVLEPARERHEMYKFSIVELV